MTMHFFFPSSDDYIAIGANCDELGAQIEEYILKIVHCVLWCFFSLSMHFEIVMMSQLSL